MDQNKLVVGLEQFLDESIVNFTMPGIDPTPSIYSVPPVDGEQQ